MIDWWNAREPREKLLLQILGGLTLLAVLVQFIMLPLMGKHSDNRMRNQQAMRVLDTVTSSDSILSRGVATLATRDQSTSISELRSVALSIAAQRGLAISRIQGGNDDEIIMILDNADPQILYAWLADLQLQHGARPSNVSLAGDASGGVRATISFGRRKN